MDTYTVMMEFFLVEFSDIREIWVLQAFLFVLIHSAALIGNILIIVLITLDQCLHTPVYFFLKKLSFDLCLISIIVPKSIVKSFANNSTISFPGCVLQVFLVIHFTGSEYALLIVMSYDRYAAICHPLYYETIMNRGTCLQMVTAAWASGCVYGSIHAAGTFSVRFCGPYIVHQFFCDIPSVLTLACSGEQILEYAFIVASFIGLSLVLDFGCFVFIDISYIHIFSTVRRIPSREGRSKAFSTCLPHLIVVTLFLSSGYFAYLRPLPKSPSLLDLLISVFYTMVPPTMNPLIYSLRNKDMKMALRKLKIIGYFQSN
ncbi:unnamed protein product [Rangifer tarandus platyrhynchus]|uniref:Uncharacterized protein n=1 Tax=Rangifer tarandus platyrhynchus TaxID=3082113 RepID=A0AC59ZJF0_RANTA